MSPDTPAQPARPWATTQEVAELVRRSPATVRAWVRRGLLAPVGRLPDGAYLFDRAAVEVLVRGCSQPQRHATVDPAAVRAFVERSWRAVRGGA